MEGRERRRRLSHRAVSAIREPLHAAGPADASGVATSCGLPLEEVDDFRIAIDELCSALIELSDGDAVRLAFELADDALVVVGTTTAAPGGVLDYERLRLSRQILGVVTDDHSIRRCGDTVSFTARERLRGRGVG